jgi:hypothetical protein
LVDFHSNGVAMLVVLLEGQQAGFDLVDLHLVEP